MELADYLTPAHIVILKGKTKAQALEELAGVLARDETNLTQQQFLEAIWDREKLMSTGIGNGIAIPHVRMAGLIGPSITVGVSRDGITDYESLDPEPICILILIAAPQGQHEVYIQLLAKVAQALKHQQLRQAIIKADNPQQVYDVLLGAGK